VATAEAAGPGAQEGAGTQEGAREAQAGEDPSVTYNSPEIGEPPVSSPGLTH